jgi:hypothetical protein
VRGQPETNLRYTAVSKILEKIGPGIKRKAWSFWSKMLTPVISAGSKSGVHWNRFKDKAMLFETTLASVVFPSPGTSSRSRCPQHKRQISSNYSASGLPIFVIAQ